MSPHAGIALGLLVLAGVLFALLDGPAKDASDTVLCAGLYAQAQTAADTAQVDLRIAPGARGSGEQTRSASATCGELRRSRRPAGAPAAQPDTGWRTFTSRSGWSISYPPDWRPFSCQSCPDPAIPDVFVSFGSLAGDGGVMVQPLEDRSGPLTVEQWYDTIARTVNLNPIVSRRAILVDDLPALDVRYQSPGDIPMEEVYVMEGHRTFAIGFDAQRRHTELDTLRSYARFQRMTATFRVIRRPGR